MSSPEEDSGIPEEDRVLFGSSTLKVADSLFEKIDAVLVSGVQSLPPSSSNSQTILLDKLRRVYKRNIDVLELYIGRNIFSIQMLQPTRRRQVVEAFLSEEEILLPKTATKEQSKDEKGYEKFEYSTETPSKQDISQVTSSLGELRTKLLAAKRRRNEVRLQLELLAKTKQLSQGAAQTAAASADSDMQEKVTSLVQGNNTMEQLQQQGSELQQKMDQKKAGRSDEEGNEDDLLEQQRNKKPKLTLEEAFEQSQKQTKTTTAGLAKMTEILKQQ